MSTRAELWLDIAWYREFHDVPRLVAARIVDGYLLFDAPFNDVLDEYEQMFRVRFVPSQVDADADWLMADAVTRSPLAHIPVSADMFDSTRRKQIRVNALLGDKRLVL